MKKLTALLLCILVLGCAKAKADIPISYTPDMIDLDLSELSGNVVYAQVYSMAMTPESFVGQTVKMSGYFDFFDDPTSGNLYTVCIIPDATACCAQGIEFVWAGEHAFPDDYPEIGTSLTVTGRFETYEEDGYMYMHLVDAEVVWGEEP